MGFALTGVAQGNSGIDLSLGPSSPLHVLMVWIQQPSLPVLIHSSWIFQIYPFSMSDINWPEYFKDYLAGIRRFLFKESDDTLPQARIKWKRYSKYSLVSELKKKNCCMYVYLPRISPKRNEIVNNLFLRSNPRHVAQQPIAQSGYKKNCMRSRLLSRRAVSLGNYYCGHSARNLPKESCSSVHSSKYNSFVTDYTICIR